MEYPKNGSVVIVDDKINDVEDLIIALSKKNVPTFYFTGKEEKLHNQLDNIKIIFLDVDYIHTPRSSKQTKLDYLVTIVSKLINEKASSYFIVTWSTLSESYHEDLKVRLSQLYALRESIPIDKKIHKLPDDIFSINKGEVKQNGLFDVNLISHKINSFLDPKDIMHLTIHWENRVLESAKNVLRNFEKIASTEEEQKKIYALFANSISEKGTLTRTNIISPALTPISTLLSDQLSSYINPIELVEIGDELITLSKVDNQLDIAKVSKINTFYHVDFNISCNNAPGSVFNYHNYMNSYSCSSKECNTKWSEGLLLKVEEDFNIPNIDAEIAKPYTEKYEALKKIKMSYKDGKPFSFYEEIAQKRDSNLDEELKKFDSNYEANLEEPLKMEILKRYCQEKDIQVVDQLIMFVFGENKNSNIIEVLNNCSQCNFESLDCKEQEKVIETYFKAWKKKKIIDEHHSKKIPIFLEFSPDCDFVQKNRKKLRLIFGLMYPYSIYVEQKNNFKGENYIYTPIIEYNGIPYKIVLDLHTITGINEEAFSNMEPIFRFRKELLVDVQQKVASHIARPGFFNMNDYLK